jgi:hypothetical protein
MNWIDRILMRIFKFFVIASETDNPYMVRYKVFRTPFFKIFLHHILRSDEDEEMHDHPWNFVSFILWSGYYEVLPVKGRPGVPDLPRRLRGGDVVRHRAADAHRLVLTQPAWTLVIVTGKKRHWGFWTERGWEPYEVFLNRKYGIGNWEAF